MTLLASRGTSKAFLNDMHKHENSQRYSINEKVLSISRDSQILLAVPQPLHIL